MPTIQATMRDRYGLHPRAALRIQQVIAGRQANVTIEKQDSTGRPAAVSSLIALVSAGITPGESVVLSAEGRDADAVLAELRELLEGGVCHP